MSSARRLGAAAALGAAFAGCAVGPDFHPPAPPGGDAYTPTPLPAQTASAPVAGGAAQRLAMGQDIPAQWWSLFRSEPLDQLLRTALANSPTMAGAEAALRQAQENYRAQTGTLAYPAVNAQLGAARERAAAFGGAPASVFNLYNASVNVSYIPDVFGGTRRTLEGARAA
ncbi:MAG TPA: TolC family protein, partial [Telluria sp.]|nr:TolC family protein [Telluria sp.]